VPRKLHIRFFLLPLKIKGQAFDFALEERFDWSACRAERDKHDRRINSSFQNRTRFAGLRFCKRTTMPYPLKNERQAFVFVKNNGSIMSAEN
jgi:hypothetical protein